MKNNKVLITDLVTTEGLKDLTFVKTWLNKVKEKSESVDNLITGGINLAKEICLELDKFPDEFSKLINIMSRNFTDRAISLGLICSTLKSINYHGNWELWANKNLSFIKERNRQKYMFLASRPDCWPLSFLGVDRLEKLCSVTKKFSGENKIWTFFNNYKIPFDKNIELTLKEFTNIIESSINIEKYGKISKKTSKKISHRKSNDKEKDDKINWKLLYERELKAHQQTKEELKLSIKTIEELSEQVVKLQKTLIRIKNL